MKKLLLLLMLASPAVAHQSDHGMVYDGWCCNGDGHNGDCQSIPEGRVTVTDQGFVVTLAPGDHRLVTVTHRFLVPFHNVRQSTDGQYHMCLYPTENDMRCFYAPPMGF